MSGQPRHPFRLTEGSPRALALLFRAWVYCGPLRTGARRRAILTILEEV